MKVTRREIFVSVSIFILSLAIAIGLTISINAEFSAYKEVLHKALQIDDEEKIDYAKKTGAGLSFINFELRAKNLVENERLTEKYIAIYEHVEEHNMHTRVVTTGKTTRTEVYWSWDDVSRTVFHDDIIKFNDIEVPYNEVDGLLFEDILLTSDNTQNLGTGSIKSEYYILYTEGKDVRYSYSAVKTGVKYSALVLFETDKIKPFDEKFYIGVKTIAQELESRYASFGSVYFIIWFLWLFITAVSIFIFYFLENKWLNKIER